MTQRVLLVEDDEPLRELVAMALRRAAMEPVGVGTGADALDSFTSDHFDLVLLDLMLPGVGGISVCRSIREVSRVPIIILTAKDETSDIVAGLDCGADDYVTKPFEPVELLARIRAVMRRTVPDDSTGVIVAGPLRIDPAACTVERDGHQIALTATDFRLLLEFAHHPRTVLSRDVLLSRVWNYDYMGDSRLVDMAVKRLRDKIDPGRADAGLIATVRGIGYRFEQQVER